jgi:hypothetical protein
MTMKEIKDGIINSAEYQTAATKILWVLKEGNVDAKDENKDRDICKEIRNGDHQKNALSIPTFRKMIYATFGILNSDVEYKNVPYANEDAAYYSLNKVAYLNINKLPGKGKSEYHLIKEAYNKYETLLLNQIKDINPHVMIFGNTLHYFDKEKLKELGWDLSSLEPKYFDNNKIGKTTVYYPISKDKLIIHAYHPAYTKMSNHQYYEEITTGFKYWQQMYG